MGHPAVDAVDPQLVNDTYSSDIPEEGLNDAFDNEPDMGAVYLLIGCLVFSGSIVTAILLYCMLPSWKSWWCFRRARETSRQSLLHASATTPADSNYAVSCNSFPKDGSDEAANYTSQFMQASIHEPSSPKQTSTIRRDSYKMGNSTNYSTINADSAGSPKSPDEQRAEHLQRFRISCFDTASSEYSHLSSFRGTLTYNLRYDDDNEVLVVHLLQAKYLPVKAKHEVCNPYVRICLLPDRKRIRTSRTMKATTEPRFDEYFEFEVEYGLLQTKMLQFIVYDYQRFSRHELIGRVLMRDLLEKSDLNCWTDFTRKITVRSENTDFGSILIGLSYDRHSECLTVSIIKASGLRPMDIAGGSDPYIKLYQLVGNKILQKRKSSVQKATLNPVFNEDFTFQIPEASINDTNILIKIMDWDRVGKDDLLGCVVLGYRSPSFSGRNHWRSASILIGENHGYWHPLQGDVPKEFARLHF